MSAREAEKGEPEKPGKKAPRPVSHPELKPPQPRAHDAGADLRRLTEIAKALNSEPDLRPLLDLILDRVVELAGAERAFLILRNDEKKLEVRASRSFDQEGVKKAAAKVSRSILVQTEKSGRPSSRRTPPWTRASPAPIPWPT